MAKKIRLGDLGVVVVEEVKAKTALEYKAHAFELFSQVIQKTPVKTGRARANWNISTDTPVFKTTTSSQAKVPFSLDTQDFPLVFISNGLDYVVELENGRSRQAPGGIINPAIAAATANRRS